MEFSTVNILTGYHIQLINQPGQGPCRSTIVDGTKGALEMFTHVRDYDSASLYHTTQQNNGESSNEWKLKNVIPLPPAPGSLYDTVGATEGYLFLRGAQWTSHGFARKGNNFDFFSLDVRTAQLKKVCRVTTRFDHAKVVHPYFGFPPSLSKPSL